VRIDNSQVIREVDPRASRDLWWLLVLVMTLVGGLVLYAWPHLQIRETSRAQDRMSRERERLLEENRKRVRLLKDRDGRPFDVVEIPMPGVVEHDGQRLPATYVNFYFVNGALLVPTYRDKKNDRKAIELLQSHLPKHKVIGIDCTALIWGLGAIHCLTQQQPRW